MKRRQCVIVSPVVPSPNGSGLQQRVFQLLLHAETRHETTVLVADDLGERLPSQTCEAPSERVRLIPVATCATYGQRAAQFFPLLVLFKPGWAMDWPALAGDADTSAKIPTQVDLCIVFRLRMHSAAQALRPILKPRRMILDLDDVESATQCSIAWRALLRGRLWLSLKSFSKAFQAFVLEESLVPLYSHVSFASALDVGIMKDRYTDVRLHHVPNRVPPRMTRRSASPGGACKTLFFIGTLSYFPNEDAVLWIVEEILPELRLQLSLPFRIVIAGRNGSQRLAERLKQEKEITFLGEVSDVDLLYAAADVALVVVRCGGGTKIKALEAAAHGCPIVGTTHAMLGLGLSEAKDYLRADAAKEIAAGCARLLQQPERARSMARSAYERVTLDSSTALSPIASDNTPF